MSDVVVVGAGLAGLAAARWLMAHGHEPTVVEARVRVVTRDGREYRGDAAIVTLPPTLAGRLEYDPPLPSWRDQLTQRTPAGSVIKVYAIYPVPFWRADGLNGQAASDSGPVKVTFDNSPPSGTPGVLMGFIEGKEARTWARRTEAERREATAAAVAAL